MTYLYKYKSAALILAAAAALPAAAQYDQDINVEGKYVPEYINHDRIGLFPIPVKFPAAKSSLAFSTKGVNADFTPNAIAIPATGWNDIQTLSRNRGYLELGLGSWLESTLSAGYRFVDSDDTTAGIRLQHNSSSLWHPKLAPSVRDVRMQHYDTSIGLFGGHSFGDYGRLDAAVDYHLGYYNYYSLVSEYYGLPLSKDSYGVPTQTINDIAAKVGWTSGSLSDRLSWNLALGYRYFALRRLYMPGSEPMEFNIYRGGRESDLSLTGSVEYATAGPSAIGLDLESHLLSYGKTDALGAAKNSGDVFAEAPHTYGAIALTPYYSYKRNNISVRLGARIDLSMNAGDPGDRYRTFNAAPDFRFDYNAGVTSLYLYVTGGNSLHTLPADYEGCYYQIPVILSTKPGYTPVDAKLGLNFGPFSGFSAGLSIAYCISYDQDYFGWYPVMLSGPDAPYALGLPATHDGRPVSYFPELEMSGDLRGFSTAVNLGYDAGRYFKIEAEGTYQPQTATKGYYNGMDRPRWTATATAESNPWKSLKLRLGVDFRALRIFPVLASYTDAVEGEDSDFTIDYRVPHWLSLNFGVSYDITKNFSIWGQANNLTNHHNMAAPGQPVPGITLTAGLSFLF